MAIPLWTNDQSNGGTMFVVSAVSTYDGGVMLGDVADKVTYTVTASAGTDTIGQHFPRMQLEIPSGTTAYFIIKKDGFLHDSWNFVGPQTPAYMDYFNFDENNNEQNGMLSYVLEDGETATIECWSEHTNGDLTPLVDAEKAVLTIVDVGFTSNEIPPVCIKPTSSLEGTDDTPLNPGNVTVVAKTTINHVGAVLDTETMTVVDDLGSTAIPLPLAGDRLDMSQWVGKTVTIHYSATDDCVNGEPSDEEMFNVTVPMWSQVITVNPLQSETSTNKHTINKGLTALNAVSAGAVGSLLEIYPPASGIYTIHVPGQGRISFGRNNCTFKFIGTIQIDGNKGAAGTTNGVILTNRAVNCLIDGGGVTITNGNHDSLVTGPFTSGTTLKDFDIDQSELYGMETVGCDRTVMINVNVTRTINPPGKNGSGFLITDGTTNLKAYDCESGNNEFNGVRINGNGNEDILWKDGHVHHSARQGLFTIGGKVANVGPLRVQIIGGEINNNDHAGLQIENGSRVIIVRGVHIHHNNTYANLPGGGETGIWFDDSTTGLLEDNDIHDNAGGFRIDSDPTLEGGQAQSTDVIVRRNKVYDNNGPGAAIGDNYAMAFRGAARCYVYNNTFWNNGRADAQGTSGGLFVLPSNNGSIDHPQVNEDLAFRNNILGKTVKEDSTSKQIDILVGDEFVDLDYNYYFDSPPIVGYQVAQVPMTYSEYRTHMKDTFGFETHSNEDDTDDPLINDTTLVPAAGSPVLGISKKLTDITAINGLEIDLSLPGYFWEGDRIEFQDRTTAVITSVTVTSVFVDAVPASVSAGFIADPGGWKDVDLYGLNNIGAVQ